MASQYLGYLLYINVFVTWAFEGKNDGFEWTSACLHCEI